MIFYLSLRNNEASHASKMHRTLLKMKYHYPQGEPDAIADA
ncbi:hypothetical protein [Pantoea sp. GD03673]|nr:hypothetical protein [Pantoea sp. GD03673]MDH2069381.1 hypothetical protein [Pantoea sp. GD03673]